MKNIIIILLFLMGLSTNAQTEIQLDKLSVGNRPLSSIPGFANMWIEDGNPGIFFDRTSSPVNERLWAVSVVGDEFRIMTEDDDFTAVKMAMIMKRTNGINIDYVSFPEGDFGIGTTTPEANLHIQTATGDTELLIGADSSNSSEDNNPYITFRQDNGSVNGFIGLAGNSNMAAHSEKYPRYFQETDGSWTTHNDYQGALPNYLLMSTDASNGIQLGTFGFVRMTIKEDGNIGIGTNAPDSKLTVAGNIHSREVKVTVNAGADFVFEENYNLPKLQEVQKFIEKYKHLPEIASAEDMEENGIHLSEMNIKLLQKIEELTLYTIEQEKQLKKQDERLLKLETLLLKE